MKPTKIPRQTHLVTRKNVGDELLVPLHGLSRPCSHSGAEETKTTTSRQNLPGNDTLDVAHFSNFTLTRNIKLGLLSKTYKLFLSFPSEPVKNKNLEYYFSCLEGKERPKKQMGIPQNQ